MTYIDYIDIYIKSNQINGNAVEMQTANRRIDGVDLTIGIETQIGNRRIVCISEQSQRIVYQQSQGRKRKRNQFIFRSNRGNRIGLLEIGCRLSKSQLKD